MQELRTDQSAENPVKYSVGLSHNLDIYTTALPKARWCPRGAGKSVRARGGGGQSEIGETDSSGQEDHYTQELRFACPRSSQSASSLGWEMVQKLLPLTEQLWKRRAPRRGKVGFP